MLILGQSSVGESDVALLNFIKIVPFLFQILLYGVQFEKCLGVIIQDAATIF